MNDLLNNILNDIEKAELSAFVANKTMYETVRKVLLAGLYYNGTLEAGKPANPKRNFALGLVAGEDAKYNSNEQIGAHLRGQMEGIRIVESAFNQMADLNAKPEQSTGKKNRAR